MLEGFLVSSIFLSEDGTNKKFNFKFIDILPCSKSLKAKQRKKGVERIERNIDVIKFIKHQLSTAQLKT